MSPTWKGYEKPGGTHFVVATGDFAHLPDCPHCRYGTPVPTKDGAAKCLDCGATFSLEEWDKLRGR